MASRLVYSRLSAAVQSNNTFISLVRGQRLATATPLRAAPINTKDLTSNQTYLQAQGQWSSELACGYESESWVGSPHNLNPASPALTSVAEVDFYLN
jgi:hypothetical protein